MTLSGGGTEISSAEQDHLRTCPQCDERLKLAGDDGVLEKQLREAEQEVRRFSMTPEPLIGDYQLVREIGRGGMGVVYEAIQRSLNRPVALKILPALLHSLRPESGDRFKAEAAAAARLQHPHIVPIYDYGQEDGCHYYAMELIRGRSLADFVREESLSAADANIDTPPLGKDYFRRVAGWIADVADALQFAHHQGVIHRDIKPSNLMLCETGRVMISDFGLAKDSNAEAVTRSGHLMGTWRYMSPEQLRHTPGTARSAAVDQRTDVYSLGATFYEVLTFQAAIPGEADHEMLRMVLEHQPVMPRKLVPQIPIELEIICTKAMAKETGQRYQTAAEFSADLRRFLNDEPIQARPPELHVRLLKYARRHRFVMAVVLVGILLATSVISTAAYLDLVRQRSEARHAVTAELVTAAKDQLDAGHYHVAAGVYSNALTRDPGLVYAYTSRALAYSELGRLDQAIDDLSSAVELAPELPGPYFRRGVLLWMRDDRDQALAEFERVLELDPKDEAAGVLRFLLKKQTTSVGNGSLKKLMTGISEESPLDGRFASLVRYLVDGGQPESVFGAATIPKDQALVCLAIAEKAYSEGDFDLARIWYAKSVEVHDRPSVIRLFCKWRLEGLAGG